MWLLSDDDPIRPEAISLLIELLRSTEANVLVFKAQGNSVSQTRSYNSPRAFLEGQHIMNLSYISALVFQRSAVEKGMHLLAPGCYTMLPHALVAMAALSRGAILETRAETLVVPLTGQTRVSRKEFLTGLATLPTFFPDPSLQKLVARQIRAATRWMIFSALAQTESRLDRCIWRRTVRLTDTSLAIAGATVWNGSFCTRWHSRADIRREILLFIARWLPDPILSLLAKRIRNKTDQRPEHTHRDGEI